MPDPAAPNGPAAPDTVTEVADTATVVANDVARAAEVVAEVSAMVPGGQGVAAVAGTVGVVAGALAKAVPELRDHIETADVGGIIGDLEAGFQWLLEELGITGHYVNLAPLAKQGVIP